MESGGDEWSDFYLWLSEVARGHQGHSGERNEAEGPSNREVELINKVREVNTAELQLQGVRQLSLKRNQEFNLRWRKVEAKQLELKQNFVKFNNFVREKQGKVESGEERRREERSLQLQYTKQLEEASRLALRVAEAKSFLVLAVKRKTLYSDYLESVVSTVKEEYKDVITLMERCQCLVLSRDNLKDRLQTLRLKTEREEKEMDRFREQKMEQTLDCNVRLSDLQLLYSVLAAKTLERGAHLRNTQERSEQKRLIISNIKLAILNMVTYCLTRGVTLPGDREGARLRDTGSMTVTEQLDTILSHISDLEVVTRRVSQSDLTSGYNCPLATEINH